MRLSQACEVQRPDGNLPGFYRHLTDTMKPLPYIHNLKGVFGILVPATQIGLARFHKPTIVLEADVLSSKTFSTDFTEF